MAMNSPGQPTHLNEESVSVQTHLGILQSTIQRMADNSKSSKNWCITIVSAVLVVVADKEEADFLLIALIPTILFAALDIYYLGLEKAFRESYKSFITKLHQGQIYSSDLYAVSTSGNAVQHRIAALRSFSIWGVYLPLVVLILVTRFLVMP